MALKWTKIALANMANIVEYIGQDDPDVASAFAREIVSKANTLAKFPGIGRAGRVAGTRELVIHRHYVIVYRTRGGNIDILRVKHTARRWPKRL